MARGQLNMADEAKIHSPINSTFEALVVQHQSGIIVEKNRSHQCCLQALQFLVHLIDLLSILLRYNGFIRIQKAVVEQTNGRPPMSMTLFWCKFDFVKCFGASRSSHWAGHHELYNIHFLLHMTIQSSNGSLLLHRTRESNTSKQQFFFLDFLSVHEAPTYWAFSPFQFVSNVEQL